MSEEQSGDEVRELTADEVAELEKLDDAIAKLELRQEQLESGEEAAEAIADDPELDALMKAVDGADSPEDLGLLEGTLKLEELEELYESEF